MKQVVLIAILASGVAAGVVGLIVWNGPSSAPKVHAPDAGTADNAQDGQEVPTGDSPEQQAATTMQELKSPEDRIAHLDWIASQGWAKSNTRILRTTIISDPDESVQIHAVETALELATKEGGKATSTVVKTSLASTKGNTRARGLKAAREYPDPELVPKLIALVDENDAYATMALNALAYTDSEPARAKILAVAEDEGADRKLRERAIALIAVTKDKEALTLLYELRNGEDESLSKLAEEVLRVLREDG